MSVSRAGLLVVVIAVAVALIQFLLPTKRSPVRIAIADGNSGSAERDPVPVSDTAVDNQQGNPVGTSREVVAPRQETDSPVEPEQVLEQVLLPEDGTLEALLNMLDDPAFQVACAQPSEADGEVLAYLVASARIIHDAFRAEEVERRLNAGLAERLDDYRPGETYTTPPKKGGGPSVSYRFRDDDAFRIEFPFKEYPQMYALRDQMRLLEGELKRRER